MMIFQVDDVADDDRPFYMAVVLLTMRLQFLQLPADNGKTIQWQGMTAMDDDIKQQNEYKLHFTIW